MKPAEPSPSPTGEAGPKTPKGNAVADATASLAPFHTHFAHRPEWQTSADDDADAERDRSRES